MAETKDKLLPRKKVADRLRIAGQHVDYLVSIGRLTQIRVPDDADEEDRRPFYRESEVEAEAQRRSEKDSKPREAAPS